MLLQNRIIIINARNKAAVKKKKKKKQRMETARNRKCLAVANPGQQFCGLPAPLVISMLAQILISALLYYNNNNKNKDNNHTACESYGEVRWQAEPDTC